jgi:CRISPR/Cas system-associated protein Csm6
MNRIKIIPTDDDYKKACVRVALVDWNKIKAEAKEIAAERKLVENRKRTDVLIKKLDTLTCGRSLAERDKYLKAQEEIDRLFEEHDLLLDIAYPRKKEQ